MKTLLLALVISAAPDLVTIYVWAAALGGALVLAGIVWDERTV